MDKRVRQFLKNSAKQRTEEEIAEMKKNIKTDIPVIFQRKISEDLINKVEDLDKSEYDLREHFSKAEDRREELIKHSNKNKK